MDNGQQMAFPLLDTTGDYPVIYSGLNKRELIAAMAMQGFMAAGFTDTHLAGVVAERAVNVTDALLAELSKPQQSSNA